LIKSNANRRQRIKDGSPNPDQTVNQLRPALEPPDATPELCADFAKLAAVAALVPKYCNASHPIGKAYQASVFILTYAVKNGSYTYVPAAYRVRNAIDAALAERDANRRRNDPSASTASLFRGLWIERQTQRDVAQRAGRNLRTVQERIQRALDALTVELEDALQHFDPVNLHFSMKSHRL
jgi:hypothetical protein